MNISLTTEQLTESLLFYRRQLTRSVAIEMVRRGVNAEMITAVAEDLANALTERLEARETGKVNGYGLKADE